MKLPKMITCLMVAFAAAIVFAPSKSAEAQNFPAIKKTYKVQVEYWFFDTDYYYWSTVLETDDRSEAEWVYNLLMMAKQNNHLNAAAPNSYWRYIAVDVRMITEYAFPNLRYQPVQSEHWWYSASLFRK